MARREDLLEQLEETVFALMMEEVAKVEGRKALEENERLKNDESFAVPETTYRKGLDTIRRHFSKNTRRTTMRTMSKLISRVAVIVLILLLLFTTAFATIPEFRAKTMNLITEVFDDRTRIEFGESPTQEHTGESECIAGWIPKDFELVQQSSEEPLYWEKYNHTSGATLVLWVFEAEKTIHSFDTEHAIIKEIVIDEYPGTIVLKGDRTQIVYFDSLQGFVYNITGEGLACEDVIRVAENVREIKK